MGESYTTKDVSSETKRKPTVNKQIGQNREKGTIPTENKRQETVEKERGRQRLTEPLLSIQSYPTDSATDVAAGHQNRG